MKLYGEVPKINTIHSSVNGNNKINDCKNCNCPKIPTKTSQLINDSNFVSDANYVHTDYNFTRQNKLHLNSIENGAQKNKIESISVNGIPQIIDENRNVDITVGGSVDIFEVIITNQNDTLTCNTTSTDIKQAYDEGKQIVGYYEATFNTNDGPYLIKNRLSYKFSTPAHSNLYSIFCSETLYDNFVNSYTGPEFSPESPMHITISVDSSGNVIINDSVIYVINNDNNSYTFEDNNMSSNYIYSRIMSGNFDCILVDNAISSTYVENYGIFYPNGTYMSYDDEYPTIYYKSNDGESLEINYKTITYSPPPNNDFFVTYTYTSDGSGGYTCTRQSGITVDNIITAYSQGKNVIIYLVDGSLSSKIEQHCVAIDFQEHGDSLSNYAVSFSFVKGTEQFYLYDSWSGGTVLTKISQDTKYTARYTIQNGYQPSSPPALNNIPLVAESGTSYVALAEAFDAGKDIELCINSDAIYSYLGYNEGPNMYYLTRVAVQKISATQTTRVFVFEHTSIMGLSPTAIFLSFHQIGITEYGVSFNMKYFPLSVS